MKKRVLRLIVSVLCVALLMSVAACDVTEGSYSEETTAKIEDAVKSGVNQALEGYLVPAGGEIPEEMQEPLDALIDTAAKKVVVAFNDSGMTETEVNKLLDITVDPNNPDPLVLFEEFKATGINGTKISKFLWSIVVSSKDVINGIDETFMPKEIKDSILAEYNKALACVTENEFKTIVSAVMDYSISSLESSLELSQIITSDTPTRSEFKALIEESKASTANLNTLLSDSFLKAAASVTKKAVAAYYMEGATTDQKDLFNQYVDTYFGYIKVLTKVNTAMTNAVDDDMADVLYDAAFLTEVNETALTIVVGKLVYASLDNTSGGTGTGLTKSFIKDIDLSYFLQDINDYVDDAMLDQLFLDAEYFEDLSYDTEELDEENLIVVIFNTIIAGTEVPEYPIEKEE